MMGKVFSWGRGREGGEDRWLGQRRKFSPSDVTIDLQILLRRLQCPEI